MPLWEKTSPKAAKVRARLQAGAFTPGKVPLCTPEVAANTLLCLINQASYLLGRQRARLERDFLEKGGFTENLYRARTRAKRGLLDGRTSRTGRTSKTGPTLDDEI